MKRHMFLLVHRDVDPTDITNKTTDALLHSSACFQKYRPQLVAATVLERIFWSTKSMMP